MKPSNAALLLSLLTCFLSGISPTARAVPSPATVSLPEAYKSALERTETVPIGQSRISQSSARIDQARANFFPKISLQAATQRQDWENASSRYRAFPWGESYARLNVFQSLYEGGRDIANVSASTSGLNAQEQNLSTAKYAAYSRIAQVYYLILSSEQEVQNIRKTLSLANDRIKEIKGRTAIGRSRNVDLLAAQAQLSVLEAQLMAAQGQVNTAREQFALMTGIDPSANLVDRNEGVPTPGNIESYVSLIEERPDIKALRAELLTAQANVKIAKSGHYPSLGATGNYYFTRDGAQKGNDYDIGLALTFPIFSGGIVKGQVREASGRELEAELLIRQLRRDAEIQVRVAYNELVSALNQLKSLEEALNSTQQNFREQEKNYRYGQATNLDVIQALNSYQDTKRTLDRTRYQAMTAWAQLNAATARVPQ